MINVIERWARRQLSRAATDPMPVQLRFRSPYTSETYVSERGWREAILKCCPAHPAGGCSFRPHTPYARKWPAGCLIARWYCPEAHQTFSLLPDFLACGVTGPLAEIEEVALQAAATTVEAAAEALRPGIELPGAVRWVQRRVRWYRDALAIAPGHLSQFQGELLQPVDIAAALNVKVGQILVSLRQRLEEHLAYLAAPTGFCTRWRMLEKAETRFNNRWGRRAREGPT
jgi:hypothetical protein